METKRIFWGDLAKKLHVTRQAVSRWEIGATVPNTETLKVLSKFFDVSINTLLGSPKALFCRCCGMPLDDSSISKEVDGIWNEEYCQCCYTEGKFVDINVRGMNWFSRGTYVKRTLAAGINTGSPWNNLSKLAHWKRGASDQAFANGRFLLCSSQRKTRKRIGSLMERNIMDP